MKKLLLFAFSFSLILSISGADFTKDGRLSYEYLKSVTVVIKGVGFRKIKGGSSVSYKQQKWLGTGVIIKKSSTVTYILTNTHVVHKPKLQFVQITVEANISGKRTQLAATVVKIHPTQELAIIKLDGDLFDKRAIKGVANVNIQEKVYLVGHHLGRRFIYGEGVFAGYDEESGLIQVPILFGDSGSGVFNSKGKLVSLVYAINSVGFGFDCSYGLVVDSYYVKDFIKKYIN